MTELPPFPGFRDEALQFFRDLKKNNERPWFKPRKSIYEDEVVWPFRCLIAELTARCAGAGLPLSGDPEKAVFRIYRDTRFSSDKTPYKTHADAVLTHSGGKNDPGAVYIHFEPGSSFAGSGFWHPERSLLEKWRSHMLLDEARFQSVIEELTRSGLSLETEDRLKRMPRGFEHARESALSEYFRFKSFVATRPLPDEMLGSWSLTDEIMAFIRASLPLLRFGWDTMGRDVD